MKSDIQDFIRIVKQMDNEERLLALVQIAGLALHPIGTLKTVLAAGEWDRGVAEGYAAGYWTAVHDCPEVQQAKVAAIVKEWQKDLHV